MHWSTRRAAGASLALLVIAGHSAPVFAKCEVKKVAELPITMEGLRPTIGVQFNGKPATLVLDSGAFYSTISGATAAQYGLKLSPAPFGLRVKGIGGYTDTSLTTVKDFGLLGLTIHDVEFLVGGSEVSSGAGLLGQNLLDHFDVEYDLAHGAVRLFKTDGCGKSLLAYWTTPDKPYSILRINSIDPRDPHTTADAYVNGKEIRVMLDSGAYTSVLSLRAAQRAGVKLDSPGVVEAGYSHGIGRANIKSYLARFDSFKIGDGEEIKNIRLRIGDLGLDEADMLLGADFFISHRIFVSNREHKAFITYNGGPVFNLTTMPAAVQRAAVASDTAAPGDGAAPADAGSAANANTAADASSVDTPADAAGYARRGAASAARRDFAPALADLSKACELAPDEPEYRYRRALLYIQAGALPQALADLDHALEVREDFLPAYLPRAEIHLQQKDSAAANADFDRVDRLAPKQADLRLELATIFARLEMFPASMAQYDLWIDSHPDDARLAKALGGRCLMSALQNQALAQGLADCNKALRQEDKSSPDYGALYADRGLVYLRQGADDKAIADFNDALKSSPRIARALYGRGVAESHKKLARESAADIAAAQMVAPQLPERYQRYGIAP